MKKYADTVFTVLVTIITTLVVNFGLGYLTRSRGTVTIGNHITFQGSMVRPVEIMNRGSEPLDGLLLSIPNGVRTTDITASSPVQIVEMPVNAGNAVTRWIKLNGLTPSAIVRLLIPMSKSMENDQIEVVNANHLGLEVFKNDEAPNLRWALLKSAAADALVYSMLVAVASFLVFSRQEELKASGALHRTQISKLEADTKTLAAKIRSDSARIRLLLLAQLSDYSRELEFWRDTARRIMYANSSSREARERFLNEVTTSLKTYSTRASAYALDHKTITTMAGMLNKAESDLKRQEEKPTKDTSSDSHDGEGD